MVVCFLRGEFNVASDIVILFLKQALSLTYFLFNSADSGSEGSTDGSEGNSQDVGFFESSYIYGHNTNMAMYMFILTRYKQELLYAYY